MKWILLLIILNPEGGSFMMRYPETFPLETECKEAGEIWKSQHRYLMKYACLPSRTRP